MDGNGTSALVADDDRFLSSLVSSVLRSGGFVVRETTEPDEAWAMVQADPPDVVVSDLDFGVALTGADLLERTHALYPGVGLVLLTSHQDPQLVVGLHAHLPAKTRYQVKSAITSGGALLATVRAALQTPRAPQPAASPRSASAFTVTAAQAEVLRLLAGGASTRAIARHRGTSVRAAELLLQRLYQALQLDVGDEFEPRVAAARLWQQGAVRLGS